MVDTLGPAEPHIVWMRAIGIEGDDPKEVQPARVTVEVKRVDRAEPELAEFAGTIVFEPGDPDDLRAEKRANLIRSFDVLLSEFQRPGQFRLRGPHDEEHDRLGELNWHDVEWARYR